MEIRHKMDSTWNELTEEVIQYHDFMARSCDTVHVPKRNFESERFLLGWDGFQQ